MSIFNYKLVRGKWNISLTSLGMTCAIVHKFGVDSKEFLVYHNIFNSFIRHRHSFNNKYIVTASIDYDLWLKYEEYINSIFLYLNSCCKYKFGGRDYKLSYKNGSGYVTLM